MRRLLHGHVAGREPAEELWTQNSEILYFEGFIRGMIYSLMSLLIEYRARNDQ